MEFFRKMLIQARPDGVKFVDADSRAQARGVGGIGFLERRAGQQARWCAASNSAKRKGRSFIGQRCHDATPAIILSFWNKEYHALGG